MKKKCIIFSVLLFAMPIAYAAQPMSDYDTLALINPTINDEEWDQNFNKLRAYINYQSREDQALKETLAELEVLSKEVRDIFKTLPGDSKNLNLLYNQTQYLTKAVSDIDRFKSKIGNITFMLPGKRDSQKRILDIIETFRKQIIGEYNKISSRPLDLFTTAIAKAEEAIQKASETMLLDFVMNVDISIWNKAVAQLQKFVVDNSSGDNRVIDSLHKILEINKDVINFIQLPLPEKNEQLGEFRFTMTMIDTIKADLTQAQKNSAFVQAGCRKLLLTCLSLIEDIAKKALDIFVNQKRQQFSS